MGAQFLQTDPPWIQYDDTGIASRLRSYRQGVDPTLLLEPGERIGLLGTDALHWTFAYRTLPATGTTRIGATIASGHLADRQGCLRATSATMPRASVTVCRDRLDHPQMPDNQDIAYAVTICDAGTCNASSVTGIDQRFGDRFAIDVTNASGMGCVTIQSATNVSVVAGSTDADVVSWAPLGASMCVSAPLARSGIAVSNTETLPAYFFRLRQSDDGATEQVLGASDLTVVSEPSMPVSQELEMPAPTLLVDASSG